MPNTKQAEKRMRRDAKRRLRNRYHLSRMKTYIRNLKKAYSPRQDRGGKGVSAKGNICNTAYRLEGSDPQKRGKQKMLKGSKAS